MNKKLIAAAIAAVVAAPAAVAADTTLYGKAHISIDSNSDINAAGNDRYTVSSNASRIGVKGSEDLGNGLKAIFKYEMTYDMTDGAGITATPRNSYVGLSGGFGTFLAGRHDTPAKVALYSTGTEIVGDATGQMINGSRGFTELRSNNAIAYISPNFSGFTVAAAIVPGEGTTGTANGIADAYSLGAMYAGGGLKVSLGYEVYGGDIMDILNSTTGSNDQKMWQASASYTFGDFKVGALYEDRSDVGGVNGADTDTWGLMASANFGNNFVTVNYAEYDAGSTAPGTTLAGSTSSSDFDSFGIQVGHKFSKRTQVYAAYQSVDNDGAGSVDPSTFSLGMIHTF